MAGHSKWAKVKHYKAVTDAKRGTGELDGVIYEQITYEGYAPGGVALLVELLTDNKNRTIAEIKKILTDNSAKWAEPGSVRWAFEAVGQAGDLQAKFKQEISLEAKEKLSSLIKELEYHDDVQKVYTNA